mgnify:CR=1 FL=1|jgi:hypothetical protein
MTERARLEYNKTDRRYVLSMSLFDNNSTTEMPLNKPLFESLIKLFKSEGKIQKALAKMEVDNELLSNK